MKFHVSHHPHKNTIRVKIWENGVFLLDTNESVDDDPKALRGGKLGVYFISAAKKVTFSKLSYR